MKLSVQNLFFKYAGQSLNVLNDINLQVVDGSWITFLGKNGCGKSTLLRLIAGQLNSIKYEGKILYDSTDINQVSWVERAKKISYIPSNFKPMQAFTVFDFILQGRFSHESPFSKFSNQSIESTKNAILRLDISDIINNKITELSSGQMQLVLLARSINQNPDVYIIDEGTSNLDLIHIQKFYSILKELHFQNKTILQVVHDINLAAEHSPKIIWMMNGKISSALDTREAMTKEMIQEYYGSLKNVSYGQNPTSGKFHLFLN